MTMLSYASVARMWTLMRSGWDRTAGVGQFWMPMLSCLLPLAKMVHSDVVTHSPSMNVLFATWTAVCSTITLLATYFWEVTTKNGTNIGQ